MSQEGAAFVYRHDGGKRSIRKLVYCFNIGLHYILEDGSFQICVTTL